MVLRSFVERTATILAHKLCRDKAIEKLTADGRLSLRESVLSDRN